MWINQGESVRMQNNIQSGRRTLVLAGALVGAGCHRFPIRH